MYVDPTHLSLRRAVVKVVAEQGVKLRPRDVRQSGKVFELEKDPVDSDLLVVMDRFDREEVYREVATLDAINPNGYYTSRLKLLGEFCRMLDGGHNVLDVLEISDPWYGTATAEERSRSVRVAIRKLLMGCRGLLTYLCMLHRMCLHDLALQIALIQSLRCPVMEHSSLTRAARMNNWKPVWKSRGVTSSQFYTLRDSGGDWQVVRKSMTPRKCNNYWRDIVNVENELKNWMRRHKSLDRLPKHRELTETGHFSLSRAVVWHGGLSIFQTRLKLPCYAKKRKPKGYWSDVENVVSELRAWMKAHGVEKLPTRQRLRETGHNALATAFRKHGNSEALAKRLDVEVPQRGRRFWLDDGNFARELLPFLVQGEDGAWTLPSQREFLALRRGDLLGAIQRRGGSRKVAEAYGPMARRATPRLTST